MFAAITSGLISASLAIMGKLVSQLFFEKVMTKVIIFSLGKIVASTNNTLDDEILIDIKARLKDE